MLAWAKYDGILKVSRLSVRLINQRTSTHHLALNLRAWQAALDLARQHGWMPMGAVAPEWLAGVHLAAGEFCREDHADLDAPPPAVSYLCDDRPRLVMLEDALNLADALERAFETCESTPIHPLGIVFRSDWEELPEETRPGVGVILALIALCRSGAFRVERF